jgi:hypothetical protein
MKTGLTLDGLAELLINQNNSKRDFVAPSQAIQITDNMELGIHGLGDFEIGEVAHEQIADRNEIPRKYYNKMLDKAPQLLAANANHWFQRDEKSSFLVRTLGNKSRALLSSRFRTLDNYDLAEIAIPALQSVGARIESCQVTERKFYLKAVTEKLEYALSPKVGDVVQAGICISNSEVGVGQLALEPLIYKLSCLNGMISPDSSFRKSHLGGVFGKDDGVQEFFKDATKQQADKLLWMQVRDVIAAFFNPDSFAKIVDRFRAAKAEVITGDPMKVVEVTAKKFSLAESEKNGVLASFLREGEYSRFGLVNAITYAAQEVPSYDRSTELERLGGQVLELPRKDWTVLSEAT